MSGPRYLSTFTGVGGADIGLGRAGWVCAGACEIDPWRRSVFMRHHPGVPVWTDIRRLDVGRRDAHADESGVRRIGGRDGQGAADCGVDLLWGSPPCQDFSVAGRRAGIDGDRGALMWEFLRAADGVVRHGAWLAMEQVPGVLSSNGGRDWAAFLWALADLGFHDVAWRVLDSRYFGVPQRRRRVFLVARRAGGERAAEVLALTEGGGGDPAPGREARAGVAGSVADGADVARRLTAGGNQRLDGDTEDFVVSTLQKPAGGWRINAEAAAGGHLVPVAHTLRGSGHDASEDGSGQVAFHPTQDPISMGDRSPALGRNTPGMGVMAAGVRRLTPRECERLQGWPDDYTRWDAEGREAADSRRYAAIGDGVTAPVTEWIGRRLMAEVLA